MELRVWWAMYAWLDRDLGFGADEWRDLGFGAGIRLWYHAGAAIVGDGNHWFLR